ncbi:MAG: FHA domain-containing protein [Deltaproteobacteria bacterium]|nr:FHA domain-containing protein [Deltaproteobacteria bacterium]
MRATGFGMMLGVLVLGGGGCSKRSDSKSAPAKASPSGAAAPGQVPCHVHTAPTQSLDTRPSSTTMTFALLRKGVHVSDEQFTQTVVKLGRLTSSHIVLEDEQAGRMHALIEIEASGSIFMNDLASELGTLVNGTRTMRQQLKDGDTISIADTQLVLTLGERPCQP